MTEQEYESFESLLKADGYRKYQEAITNEDYFWCKGFEYMEDKYGEKRPSFQVIYSIWDYRDKPYCHVPNFDKVGISVRVVMIGDVRIDLELTIDKIDIKLIETKAYSFFEWVTNKFWS